VSNRLSDAIYMTKRVVARHPNVDLAAPYPRKLAFDGGEHMVIVKLGVQTGRHVALDRLYIMLKPTLLEVSVWSSLALRILVTSCAARS